MSLGTMITDRTVKVNFAQKLPEAQPPAVLFCLKSDCLDHRTVFVRGDVCADQRMLPCGDDSVCQLVFQLLFDQTAQIARAELDRIRFLAQPLYQCVVPGQANAALLECVAQLSEHDARDIQGAILAGDAGQDIVLLDVTPLTLGIETMGGVMTKLIDANSTIPCKKSEVFSTAADNQTAVTIHVLQGERPMAAQNKSIGNFNLEGIAPARRGVPQIEVTFDIDANGILSVSAKDKATGKEQSIRIEASSGLSKEDIERMKAEAEANADADKKEREKIDKLNQADSMIFQTENMLKESGDKLPADVKAEVEAAVNKLKDAHKAQDLAAIDAAIAELNNAAQKMYQAQAGAQQAGPQPGAQGFNGGSQTNSNSSNDAQDADFEEVK